MRTAALDLFAAVLLAAGVYVAVWSLQTALADPELIRRTFPNNLEAQR